MKTFTSLFFKSQHRFSKVEGDSAPSELKEGLRPQDSLLPTPTALIPGPAITTIYAIFFSRVRMVLKGKRDKTVIPEHQYV